MLERGTHPLPFFWKCVKRKGFKSFVLKLCETKGVTDAFLRKCVKLKSLGGILASFPVPRIPWRALAASPAPWRTTRQVELKLPSGRLAITTKVRIPQMTSGRQGLIWESSGLVLA